MRVLILTHERSGGRSLMEWISSELNLNEYHEPLGSDYSNLNFIDDKNCVVKEFPNRIYKDLNLIDTILSFDKLILHNRVDLYDMAVSTIYAAENFKENWHQKYTLSDYWEKNHQEEIIQYMTEFQKENDVEKLLKFGILKYCGIHTTYEGVFYRKTDIQVLCDYLNIANPTHLSILDSNKRLRLKSII